MDRYGLRFVKKFGQNFLTDANIVRKIADSADLSKDESVIEIGPGIGTLTRELSDRAGNVTSVEIDKKLIPVLEETLQDKENVKVLNKDVLKLLPEDFPDGPFKVVANLPYNITSPVIFFFLESDLDVKSLQFLIQKEVAERIVAEPGSKIYGALSVIAQYYADPEILFDVPAGVFMPRPKVDSSLIRLTKKIPDTSVDKGDYFKVVRAGFANRRKTLINSLASNLGVDKERIKDILIELGFDPRVRAENLSPDDFKELTRRLYA